MNSIDLTLTITHPHLHRLVFFTMLSKLIRQLPNLKFSRYNSAVAAAVSSASESTGSMDMYKYPRKWHGMGTKQLLKLHNERKARLGHLYEPTQEEFTALIPSAIDLGFSTEEFKKLYFTPEEKLEMENQKGDKKLDFDQPDTFKFDELTSQAHLLVHQHREQRYYNRLAAYELPLLVQHRQEYRRKDTSTHPLKYRYTTYIGEDHPNSRKVVLSVKTADLNLNEKELHKLRLLARTRYDHITDEFKMSSDRFANAAQNAQYLSKTFQKLLKEARDMTDDFSDIPLDTRHTIAKNLRKKKRGYEFPEEWKRPQDAPKKVVDLITKLSNSL
ncbi:HBR118Cp [Eremothecium sinecaudum]|uniref:Small ribosomal subunit protein mS35 n=1 Tax=Eremothecium sinecaudum TaxID=45286 RepID=A0A120K149_9SACH|nr:HBR118Cp [Eremothecium sinecaudum]AMD19019.1 HBR118Cp [Eremothecium sinecaudum]